MDVVVDAVQLIPSVPLSGVYLESKRALPGMLKERQPDCRYRDKFVTIMRGGEQSSADVQVQQ